MRLGLSRLARPSAGDQEHTLSPAVWDELWLAVTLLGHHSAEHLVWRVLTDSWLASAPLLRHSGAISCRRLCQAPAAMSCLAACLCVSAGGPARLQGELAVSRALGDLPFRRFGLTAQPELHWYPLCPSDWLLLLVSDGALEKLTPVELCQAALAAESGAHIWSLVCTASCAHRGGMHRLQPACLMDWVGTTSLSCV